METSTAWLQTLKVISATFVRSSTAVASMVNFVAEVTPYCPFEEVKEHEVPAAGAVTSIQEPLLEESVAEPDFRVHATWFVLPFVTVANTRRVELAITLKPKGGCPTAIPTGPV